VQHPNERTLAQVDAFLMDVRKGADDGPDDESEEAEALLSRIEGVEAAEHVRDGLLRGRIS
jgi:hypothetical protein